VFLNQVPRDGLPCQLKAKFFIVYEANEIRSGWQETREFFAKLPCQTKEDMEEALFDILPMLRGAAARFGAESLLQSLANFAR
jgi:hypothetical protein